MSEQDCFPTELLTQSNRDRWQYFYHKIVAHRRLIEVDRDLMQAIRYAPPGRLILVFGPTGVGKTTLRRGIVRALIDDLLSELKQDQGRIPVADVDAVSPELGSFDWFDFYQRALISLNEPLINDKVVYDAGFDNEVLGLRRDGEGREKIVIHTKSNLRTLRQALEKCLRYRRPAAFILDDGHYLQKIPGGRRLRDQMDAIRSLTNRSQTVCVLIGTYELLNMTNLSDQVSRCSCHVPFTRYRADCEQDIEAFKTVLKTFQQHLPLPQEPDLVGRWDYFYEYSAGCVGILKLWLCDALADALQNSQKTLTSACLQRQAMSPDRLMSVVRESIEGERKLEEQEKQGDRVRSLLGLEPVPDNHPKNDKTASGRRRVGERLPFRDSIGGQNNEH